MRLFLPKQARKCCSIIGTVLVVTVSLFASVAAAANDIVVYDDNLEEGWQNYSYGATVDFSNTSQVYDGIHSAAVTMNGWAGFYLHKNSVIDLTGYERLSFWIRGNSNSTIRFFLNYDSSISKYFSVTANTWTLVNIPLSDLGNPPFLRDIHWMNNSDSGQTVYFDKIKVIASTNSLPVGPILSVDVTANRHPISDDIYGMNYASENLAQEIRLPVRRWGGNATSRYNWKNDVSNKGSDWYYENVPMSNSSPQTLPDGSAADKFVDQDRRTNTRTLMTAPLIGWVPKRRIESHPYDCGFKVSRYGEQQSVDGYDPDCGNGIKPDGQAFIEGNDPTDTSTAIGPSFVSEWINHLVAKYGTAANGGVKYYNLDNEPMLWNSTQRDVHPQPTSYDELRDRTYQYAAAIKQVDSSAKTLGPAVWGWCAYFHSAVDDCYDRTDYQTHGNVHFVPWYLQEMQRYEQQHGVRILDYLDLHIYPQVGGVYNSNIGTTTAQKARLRSIRQLWDESYTHEGWIGQSVYLIPRMKQWINANYPGTKTAITEYNWGALGYLSGALAQADILGVFGREGLDLATLWAPPSSTDPGAFAFRLYRNYDGAGSGFGKTSVQALSSDQETLSIYAAERSEDNVVTVMVINKKPASVISTLQLAGVHTASIAEVYRYGSANLQGIERLSNEVVADSKITTTYPGNSITLLVLPYENGGGGGGGDGDGNGDGDQESQTLLVDFGSFYASTQANGWNNVTEEIGSAVGARLTNLVNTQNNDTPIDLVILNRFNGANTNGTSNSAHFTASATSDSLFGNTENWSGLTNVMPKFKLTGLDPQRAYHFTFYASRMGVSDARETKYTIVGRNTTNVTLNPANNVNSVVETSVGIIPDQMNEITISLAPTENNNNPYHFTYLGVMKVVDDEAGDVDDEDTLQTLQIDFGSLSTPAGTPGWNNVTENIGKVVGAQLNNLVNIQNEQTPLSLEIINRFNAANTNGTLSSTHFMPNATRDSLFGNTERWNGLANVMPRFKLKGLVPQRVYRLTFYASRLGVGDIRETEYTVAGQNTATVVLDSANNINDLVTVEVVPNGMNEITVGLAPAANNNNYYHFTYLGAMKVEEML